jgi:hypothetical protein
MGQCLVGGSILLEAFFSWASQIWLDKCWAVLGLIAQMIANTHPTTGRSRAKMAAVVEWKIITAFPKKKKKDFFFGIPNHHLSVFLCQK